MNYRWLTMLVLVGYIAAVDAQQVRTLHLTVVDSHVDPNKPLAHVRVTLGYLRGDSFITQGMRLTNGNGEALLHVPENAPEIGTVQVTVARSDVPGLVIYQPAGGILETLPRFI